MMKRSGNYNNKQGGGGGGNRFGGGNGGGNRGNYRKGGGGGNGGGGNNHQFNDQALGDSDTVHPRQRRHLQAQKDRFVALAREAISRGDRILAEFYYQHVEHYSRMIGLIPEQQPQQQRQPRNNQQNQNDGTSQNAEANENGNNNGNDSDNDSDSDHDDGGDDNNQAPSGFGHGPSSFYAQPSSPPANAPVEPPEDEAANY